MTAYSRAVRSCMVAARFAVTQSADRLHAKPTPCARTCNSAFVLDLCPHRVGPGAGDEISIAPCRTTAQCSCGCAGWPYDPLMAIATTSPVTGEILKSFDELTPEELEDKLARAAAAAESYRLTSVEQRAGWLAKSANPESTRVLGPAPAPIERIKQRYRWQVLIKARRRDELRAALASVTSYRSEGGVRVSVDIDPINML